MRLRCGGTVVYADTKTVLIGVCVIVTLCVAMLYGLTRTSTHQISYLELDVMVQPTPIDQLLQRIMNDRDLDEFPKPRTAASSNLRPKSTKAPYEMAMGDVVRLQSRELERAKESMVGLDNRPPDSRYSINVTLSDSTSLDRDLPDTRPPSCRSIVYDSLSLPRCTVIIPFFNEAPTMILRAVHSVLNRSPGHLLDEIILVDDMSFDAPLKSPLQRYLDLLPRVRLVRHNKRSGLIVARMIGARLAKSPVIIFLDAHTEVNVGWLEPMLHEIKQNPKQVLQPYIDGVDMRTLAFTSSPIYYKGAFSWDLRYTWLKLTDHEQNATIKTGQPFFSPTLVGCAIAVDTDYFFKVGAFDEGMRVWGGENIELAFRVWMCGGQVTTVTCSRVGHVFKQSPNKFDGTEGTKENTIQRNLMRVADVWMDSTKKFFYATSLIYDYKRFKLAESERASVRERIKQREELKCHNFEWYMYNVIPEMNLPPMESRYFGEIMNLHTRACWEITEDYYVGMTYFCFEHKSIPKNDFALTADGLLRYRDRCVTLVDPKPYLTLDECPTSDFESFGVWSVVDGSGSWGAIKVSKRNEKGVMVYWCIAQVTNVMEEHANEQMPQLMRCQENDKFQIWGFTYGLDFSHVNEYLTAYD